jgi:hypothetical protein
MVTAQISKPVNMTLPTIHLFNLLNKSEWLIANGSNVVYQFANLEINDNGNIEGILFMGEKLLDFVLEEKSIVYKSFRIDKYIFLITSYDTLTVYINNDELESIQLHRICIY